MKHHFTFYVIIDDMMKLKVEVWYLKIMVMVGVA